MKDRFATVEEEYFRLKGQFVVGRITREQFETALKKLIIKDDQGRYWMLGLESGAWHIHDGTTWIQAQPSFQSDQSRNIKTKPALPKIALTLILVMCVCAVLVIAIGIQQGSVQIAMGTSPTPIAVSSATPTLTPLSTPTLVAMQTLTHTPTATRTPTQSLTPTRLLPTATLLPTLIPAFVGCPDNYGSLALFDDFANTQSGWTVYRGTDYEHFYENGEWHFQVFKANTLGHPWMLLRDLGARYRIEAQARKMGGPNMNDYGLFFGGQNDLTYDEFLISDTGSYKVNKKVEGQNYELATWTKTPLVRQGGLNYLGVKVEGTQFILCVNGNVLATMNDPSLKSGRVGMIAGAFDEPAHIHFDNFRVWKLD